MSVETPRCIAIVRHGETDWNRERRIQGRTEVPLNDTGRRQAAATARQLAAPELRAEYGQWRGILTSPLGRAIETARIIGTGLTAAGLALPAEPTIDQRLTERNFGMAEGMLVEEFETLWPGFNVPGAENLDGVASAGGAEPLDMLAERSAGAFSDLLTNSPGVILVAHGAMIRAGLTRLTGTAVPRVLNGEIWLLDRNPETGGFHARSLPIASDFAYDGAKS